MNDDNQFGEVIESAATQAKQIGQQVASQVLGTGGNSGGSDSAQQPVPDVPAAAADTQKVVESLYEQSTPPAQASGLPQQPAGAGADPLGKTPQELEQIAKIKQEIQALHNETYYDPLVNPAKQDEESVSEKIEREDQEKDWELKQKEMEAPPDLAVQRAQTHTEVMPGTSG